MYSEPLAHQIYAAADIILVPSMFEPCGLTQVRRALHSRAGCCTRMGVCARAPRLRRCRPLVPRLWCVWGVCMCMCVCERACSCACMCGRAALPALQLHPALSAALSPGVSACLRRLPIAAPGRACPR